MQDAVVTLPLSKGYATVIDAVDGDLAAYKWSVSLKKWGAFPHPNARRNIYSNGGSVTVLLHREIMARIIGRPLGRKEYVDHIDGNALNNRRANLRLATPAQNNLNRRKSSLNKSGYKGVYFDKGKKRWRADLSFNGKGYRLGRFDTPEEAHAAYCEAAKKYHGEFARFD